MPDDKPQPTPDATSTRAERPVSGMSRPSSGTNGRHTDHGNEVLASGTTFGKYTIVRLIGAGGMGAVYEATHSALRKRYAVKVLHPLYASQDDIRARFIREGESASRINHPNVVSVTDFGIQDETPFLVMEYLEGESLADMIERDGALPAAKLVELMLPVCAAIGAAHDEGVVHRDLKPDNVFLARRGGTKGAPEITPKVVDFGISKVSDGKLEASLTSTGSMIGTPHYMSPEQMRASKHVDARSDQYSFGVLLYECATGRKPFDAETLYELIQKIALGNFKKPRELKPEIPEALEAVILKAMAHEPANRYPTMSALGFALLPFANERTHAIWQGSFASAPEDGSAMDPAMHQPPSHSTRVVTIGGQPEVVLQTNVKSKPSTLANTGREIEVGPARPSVPVSSRRTWILGGVAAAAIAGGALWIAHKPTPAVVPTPPVTAANASSTAPHETPAGPTAPSTFRATVTVEPAAATIDFDGQPGGTGIASREFAADGRQHTATVRAAGFLSRTVSFRDAPPPGQIRLDPDPSAVAPPTSPVGANTAHATNERDRHHGGNTGRPTVAAGPGTTAPTGTTPAEPPHTPPPSTGPAVGTNGAVIIAP